MREIQIINWLALCALLTFVNSITFAQEAEQNTVAIDIQTHNLEGENQRNTRFVGVEGNSCPSGRKFYSFRGIAYAKPPIGELRFRDPQPLHEWPPVVDARWDGHDCPSIYAKNASEDCLTLNVYSADLHANASLPVIVFIHPGGLYIGSGLSSFIGPEYLLEHRVVLITFNYRLGALGFLNLGTKTVPGNAGFKDQVHALRWVRSYVRHFGGDAERITLMGYSAGALSVAMHLVSPMSRGLFSKAIVMSGALPPQTPLPLGEQRTLARRQAQVLNCSDLATNVVNMMDEINSEAVLRCLNKYSGSEIAATLRQMFNFGKDNPVYLWLPVREWNYGQERFLIDDFYGAIRAGRFQRVPLLIGYTNGELCTSAADIKRNATLNAQFHNAYMQLAPTTFMYDHYPPAAAANGNYTDSINAISNSLKAHYTSNRSDISTSSNSNTANTTNHSLAQAKTEAERNVEQSEFTLERLCDLFSDALVRFGSELLAHLAVEWQVPVKRYFFTQRSKRSHLDYATNEMARVEHMDDLMYIFRMATPVSECEQNADLHLVKLYSKFIYDFIAQHEDGATGRTTKTSDDCKASVGHVRIGEVLSCVKGSSFQEFDFWQKLFPNHCTSTP